ncbi:hypothetical protein CHI12_03780 [Terribacillus saccharophilus]|jgi:predicted acylesterase/phospholipase RssA|uniref:Uncharacterized protein n=1 Tax=Terribacillus saccharophilus TaxID=361277 RepID=A0A268HGE5_9BACI|nr:MULTISPECIES: hypothetical protein [Terribacillus]PAD36511.1 hypothetical protein CHH56_03750 [Terribacillus saccharophilus]PAD97167.1 hypothetical protein CHH50_04425 [Terribacillus saccharophilus]PAE00923.1 hypothetical protein CHH48_04450 [Terribacillus saccharophilus]PAE08944.1 hypothetical protein CHI12_03780 [Terribacillus saccharophilus]
MFDMLQFLVPLAIAAIAFFFNAAAKKGDKENNDPRRTQPPVKNWQEKQPRTNKEQRQQKQVKAPELIQAEQKADEFRKQATEAIQQVVEVRSASSVRQGKKGQQITKPIRLKRLTSKQLAEQVLWSEILGEPRAKKPHRTFNKRVQ